MADRVGQQFGNYRLVSLIGHGGFADVYLGEHIYLDTPAAIKVLRTELASEDIEHFRKEARIIARLVHPHIVRVLEFGVENTTPFLVVDYAPNGTLRKRYKHGQTVPLSLIVSYTDQAADALQYAHDQKVVHRDVKPENMLLGRQDEVLLSDFGIALIAQTSRYQSTNSLQEAAGTIAYMAPEQIQSHAVPNSDQYALAVVVYEWLCGARPFQGTFTEVAVKQTLVPPPPLRQRVPALSPALEEVVMRALAKEPSARFPTVRDFAQALRAVAQGQPDSYEVVSDPSVRQVTESSDTLPIEEDGASVALLSEPGQFEQSTPSMPLLTPEQHDTPPLPKTGELAEGEAREPERPVRPVPLPRPQKPVVDLPAEAPPVETPKPGWSGRISRRAIILGAVGTAIAGGVAGGLVWLEQLRSTGDGSLLSTVSPGRGKTLYVYRGHMGWVWAAAWSHDGQRIASASSDKTVQVWESANGQPIYTYSGHPDSVYTLGWSPQDTRIASAGNDQTAQVWDSTGGHPFTYSGHSSWIWSLAWSPDGRRIASAGGDQTVQIWNAADGKTLYTYKGHSGSVFSVAWSPDGQYLASAGSDKTVQVWNANDGSLLYTYQPYANSIWSVSWSPDGKRIASAADNKTVQVWDAMSGDHLYIYYGHTDFVYTVAWSPNGQHIASGGDDRTVRVWNANNGGDTYVYTGHTAPVRSVAWSPDSKRLVSAGFDRTVRIWQIA